MLLKANLIGTFHRPFKVVYALPYYTSIALRPPLSHCMSYYMCVVQGGVLSLLGSLGMMFWLAMIPHNSDTEKKRLAILAGFAFFTGKCLIGLDQSVSSPLFIMVDLSFWSIVPFSFLIS